jgi:hypothetical protein
MVEIDYDPADLDRMGKSFREFKLGVERTIKADLLPTFTADPHSRITLSTLAFPSARKLKLTAGHRIMEKDTK